MKTRDDFQTAMAPIKRHYIGVTDLAEIAYRNRDRLILVTEDPGVDYYAYRCSIDGDPEQHMQGTDTRPCVWLKDWIEAQDRQEEAIINAWRASKWLSKVIDAAAQGAVPGNEAIYRFEFAIAMKDLEHGIMQE